MINPNLKRKLIIGGTAAVVVTVVILEKRRVDNIVEMAQAAVYETMNGSFDEGVKYGIKLARENATDLLTPLKEMHELNK